MIIRNDLPRVPIGANVEDYVPVIARSVLYVIVYVPNCLWLC